jgi:hypothetical protein
MVPVLDLPLRTIWHNVECGTYFGMNQDNLGVVYQGTKSQYLIISPVCGGLLGIHRHSVKTNHWHA